MSEWSVGSNGLICTVNGPNVQCVSSSTPLTDERRRVSSDQSMDSLWTICFSLVSEWTKVTLITGITRGHNCTHQMSHEARSGGRKASEWVNRSRGDAAVTGTTRVWLIEWTGNKVKQLSILPNAWEAVVGELVWTYQMQRAKASQKQLNWKRKREKLKLLCSGRQDIWATSTILKVYHLHKTPTLAGGVITQQRKMTSVKVNSNSEEE